MIFSSRSDVGIDYLVSDDQQLCNAALDRGCLDALGSLILALGPTEPAPPEWEEAEAAATQALREVSPQMFSLFIVFPLIMNFRLHSPPLPLSLSRRTCTVVQMGENRSRFAKENAAAPKMSVARDSTDMRGSESVRSGRSRMSGCSG